MIRIVQAAIVEYTDAVAGNVRIAFNNEAINPDAATEARLNAAGLLAPAAATVASAEAESELQAAEYASWKGGTTSEPAWALEVALEAGA